jgi:hypothetical protein
MTTVPDIPVVQVPVRESDDPSDVFTSTVLTWAPVEVPRGRRPSPVVLAALGTLAGVAAMALGAFAVVTAGRPDSDSPALAPGLSSTSSAVEARALRFLAKPSTERIVFHGSGGRLVLAVGSSGRAAILVRGLPRRPAAKPYVAWVVRPGGTVRVARFVGTERVVFLSAPVPRDSSVVVSAGRPAAHQPARSGFVALRA